MDEKIQRSCWGTAAWAVIGFACIMTVVYLTGIHDASQIAAALPR